MRLVLASNNAKKLAELEALFGALPIELVAQSALGVAEAEEPHPTFVENALAKARHAARGSGDAAIADDSGLCVDALGGAPGVISAHFAASAGAWTPDARATGPGASREARRRAEDAANNALLLQRLAGRPAGAARAARFVCTLVALRHAEDPEPLIAFGRWDGEILEAPRGAGGFGYDPLMWIPALGATVAELDPARKNEASHRARAAQQMRTLMREVWRLG